MADDDLPAGYNLSRAAQRKRYGARSIDGSAPLSSRSSTGLGLETFPTGGKTDETSWRKFFNRPVPVGPTTAAAATPKSVSAFPEMGMEQGKNLSDPSQAFRVAGAPPIGGPSTGRSALTDMGMNVPMPTTPSAMQYYQEGIKGSQPFMPGGVRSGDSFSDTRYGSGGKPGTASVRSESMREFFDRYLKRRA